MENRGRASSVSNAHRSPILSPQESPRERKQSEYSNRDKEHSNLRR